MVGPLIKGSLHTAYKNKIFPAQKLRSATKKKDVFLTISPQSGSKFSKLASFFFGRSGRGMGGGPELFVSVCVVSVPPFKILTIFIF